MNMRRPIPPQRTGLKRGIYLLPNLCTTANLFFGFFAIVKALHHQFVMAAWFLMLAGAFDFLDGKMARLAKAESDFGIEYDALADLVAFGLAPAVLIYSWTLASFERFGWLAAFIYVACGALRLARFNVQAHSVERNDFQGLPIPMAAAPLVATVIFHQHVYGQVIPLRNWWFIGLITSMALLMISTVRYRSLKKVNMRSQLNFFVLVGVVGLIAIIAYEPQISLFVLSFAYVASGLMETTYGGIRSLVRRDPRERRKLHQVLRDKIHELPRRSVEGQP